MANCDKLFRKFDSDESCLKIPSTKIDKLETSQENLRDKIRKDFEKNHPQYKPRFNTQGSYKMETSIRTKDDTCDLDDGVYFKNNPEDVTGTTLQKWIKDAVDGTTDATPNHRKKCITVDYKAGYNIDLPVFLFDKDKDDHPQLAVKDSNFKEDDPKEFFDHFNQTSNAQMIRIIRYLKAWGNFKSTESCKMPTGLAMTVLALDCFQKNDRDDIALKFTLTEIENTLKATNYSFTCIMPTTPKDDLFANYSQSRKDNFLNRLSDFIKDAKKAVDEESNQLQASKLWQKHLGDRFPEGEDKNEEKPSARSLAPIIGTQKPYCGK